MKQSIDTFVIGGSAGGFSVLRNLLPELPADFPAAIFICLHQSSTTRRHGAELLRARSRMPVCEVEDGLEIAPGTVYFAVPDRHLMIGADHVHLRRGAHENNFRPAIDPLFRSAAVYRGTRAVGIVLSGLMDDGAAGARALTSTGGKVLVQAPGTADFPNMPEAALRAVPTAEAIEAKDLARRMIELAGTACDPPREVPWRIGLELKIAGLEGASMNNEDKLGTLSPYNCPHCNGVLWEVDDDGPPIRFRCHTGHAFTLDALNSAQEKALDESLFNALRAHKGRASLIRRLAENAEGQQSKEMFEARMRRVEEDAERLEQIILQRGGA